MQAHPNSPDLAEEAIFALCNILQAPASNPEALHWGGEIVARATRIEMSPEATESASKVLGTLISHVEASEAEPLLDALTIALTSKIGHPKVILAAARGLLRAPGSMALKGISIQALSAGYLIHRGHVAGDASLSAIVGTLVSSCSGGGGAETRKMNERIVSSRHGFNFELKMLCELLDERTVVGSRRAQMLQEASLLEEEAWSNIAEEGHLAYIGLIQTMVDASISLLSLECRYPLPALL